MVVDDDVEDLPLERRLPLMFCVPSTFVNVTAWLAMKSSSVAGADVDAYVRQPLALTFLSSPVISGAP